MIIEMAFAGVHTTYARQLSQASKWAAITCVVVNAPVIGKIAQVLFSFEQEGTSHCR